MSLNGKHLSLEDRKIIEENICKGLRKFELPCFRKDRFIGACNCCPEIKHCKKAKYFYYANVAQKIMNIL